MDRVFFRTGKLLHGDRLMDFVCPACRGGLHTSTALYTCAKCDRRYPVVCGIPDFRLFGDPYIGIEEDRIKAQHLAQAALSRDFAALVAYYYSITPEDPADLAVNWIAHALAEVDIARELLSDLPIRGTLLDLGCSTGGLLIAAEPRVDHAVGIDVALRWLVIGSVRLREAGSTAQLVCANTEALPFASERFDFITATDLMEHLRDLPAGLEETRRVLRPGADTLWTTNNRFAPLPDPQVHLWGVGLLPRSWQSRYVAFRRGDLHHYHPKMRGAVEIERLFRHAGFRSVAVRAASLIAPHRAGLKGILTIYNAMLLRVPLATGLLRIIGPRLSALARR